MLAGNVCSLFAILITMKMAAVVGGGNSGDFLTNFYLSDAEFSICQTSAEQANDGAPPCAF